jgi:RimJ/RimL family protein N-acetyltransferase
MNDIKISTSRFILRELTPDDATVRYLGWFENDSIKKNIQSLSTCSASLEELRNFITENINKKDVLFLGIFLKNKLLHIGNIKFNPVDSFNHYTILGIMIGDENWQGRGVAPEVIASSASWLKKNRGIRSIVLGVDINNSAAISAYSKVGFKFDKTKYIEIIDKSHVSMVLNIF